MYEYKKTTVLNPSVEVRLRCLESAIEAWKAINKSKHFLDAQDEVLTIAERYEEWALRPTENERK